MSFTVNLIVPASKIVFLKVSTLGWGSGLFAVGFSLLILVGKLLGEDLNCILYDSVILHLFEPYLHQGHHLFADGYYSSIPLAQALYDNETTSTGTHVSDRVDLSLSHDLQLLAE